MNKGLIIPQTIAVNSLKLDLPILFAELILTPRKYHLVNEPQKFTSLSLHNIFPITPFDAYNMAKKSIEDTLQTRKLRPSLNTHIQLHCPPPPSSIIIDSIAQTLFSLLKTNMKISDVYRKIPFPEAMLTLALNSLIQTKSIALLPPPPVFVKNCV